MSVFLQTCRSVKGQLCLISAHGSGVVGAGTMAGHQRLPGCCCPRCLTAHTRTRVGAELENLCWWLVVACSLTTTDTPRMSPHTGRDTVVILIPVGIFSYGVNIYTAETVQHKPLLYSQLQLSALSARLPRSGQSNYFKKSI